MAYPSFHRASEYVRKRPAQVVIAVVCGAIRGALYVGWIILLTLFLSLKLSSGMVVVTEENRELLSQVTIRELSTDQIIQNAGVLAVINDQMAQPTRGFAIWLYRNIVATHTNNSFLLSLLMTALLLAGLRLALGLVQAYAIGRATSDALREIKLDVINQRFALARQATKADENDGMADVLKSALGPIEQALRARLEALGRDPVKSLLLVGLACLLNLWLAITFLILLTLFMMALTQAASRISRRRVLLERDADRQTEMIFSLADKIRLFRGYNAEDISFWPRMKKSLDLYARDVRKHQIYEARLRPLVEFALIVVGLVVLGLGAQNVLTGKYPLSSILGLFAALASLILPVFEYLRRERTYRIADEAAQRLFSYIDQNAESPPVDGTKVVSAKPLGVEFVDIGFVDVVGRPLLNDLSITIPPGKRVALVGTNHAELQAILLLLARHVDPTSGQIHLNGDDLRSLSLHSLRASVALVFGRDWLFPGTVASNISCDDTEYSEEKIHEAAKMAHAHQFIQKLPHGYDCVIGPHGFPVKAGEAYRIALARAILRAPKLALVEEPRDALDDDTKSVIEDAYQRFFSNRTAIIIPSRLTTVRGSEIILLISNGRLVDSGSHRDLLERSELYRHVEYTQFHRPKRLAKV